MNARTLTGISPASDVEPFRGVVVLPFEVGGESGPADYRALSQCLSVYTALAAANRAALAEFEITARQYICLVEAHCGGRDGAASIGEVAQRLRVRHNTAVGAVTRLCDMGYMVRKRDANDRRKVRLELTPKGTKMLDQIARRYWQTLRKVEPGLLSRAG